MDGCRLPEDNDSNDVNDDSFLEPSYAILEHEENNEVQGKEKEGKKIPKVQSVCSTATIAPQSMYISANIIIIT